MEIHQKAYANFTHAEVGQDLGIMRRDQRGNRLNFKNYGILDKDVGTEPQWDRYVFINYRDCDLALEFNVGSPELKAHAFRVHGFEQPRSDRPAHFDRKANDALRQVALFQHLLLRAFSVVSRVLRGKSY
jgi:hypothetical protein